MRYFILLFWFLSASTVHAQDLHIIDSLKSVIKKAKRTAEGHARDTVICNANLLWCEEIYLSNPDMAFGLWQKTLELAEENLSFGPAPQPDQLSNAVEKAYLSALAEALNGIGYIYEDRGDISKALDYYHRSLKIEEDIGNQEGIATSLNNIGYTHDDQGDIPKALEYYHKSLKIEEDIGNKQGAATSLNNIGIVYHDQGDLSNALKYYSRALKINEEIESKSGIATTLNNIGFIHHDQGDIPKALEYYHRSLKIEEDIGNKQGAATTLNNIGHIELEQGRLTGAWNYGLQGLDIARDIGAPNLISVNSNLLSKVASQRGNFEEALEMYELHIQMRDSIKNDETHKATIRQQTKYEFEKVALLKEQEQKESQRIENEATSRRNNLQYSVILIALLVLSGGIVALGFINVSERMAEGIIFFSFLILFEFLLVLADPYIEGWSGGAPGIKLLFNAGIAALIFPAHAFFESRLKGRLVKQ